MKNIVNYVQNKWESKELPGITNLLFANGEVLLFNRYKVNENGIIKRYCFPLCETNVYSLEKYNEDIWSEIEFNKEKFYNYMNGLFYYGEGSMGNEGFICFVDKNNKFQWSYFFDFSNPIVDVYVKNDILICLSSSEIVIEINLNSKEQVVIGNLSD
ncbi:MAG: hypothetical protein LBG80_16245 [Bacteroidales bacterium]|jgi:hypothetical protein|nr:hypothetical protein [Bacteroidales bacterium]